MLSSRTDSQGSLLDGHKTRCSVSEDIGRNLPSSVMVVLPDGGEAGVSPPSRAEARFSCEWWWPRRTGPLQGGWVARGSGESPRGNLCAETAHIQGPKVGQILQGCLTQLH